jgi:hypothetical protein
MQNYTFSESENNFMKYFSKDEILFFFLVKTTLDDVLEITHRQKYPQGRNIDKVVGNALNLIFYKEVIAGIDKEVTKLFIDNYLKSDTYKKNLFVGIQNFGEKHFKYECELLIDLLYCICTNCKEFEAVINLNETSSMSTLNFYKKPTGVAKVFDSSKRTHLWSVPLAQLDSYVANNIGITIRFKNGKYAKIGQTINEEDFETYLAMYKLNLGKFFFNEK